MTDDPLDPTDAASAEERAANGENPPEAEELFERGSLDGEGVTPQTLIGKREPVKVTVSIGKAEVPVRGDGLLNPKRLGRVLVTYRYQGQTEVAHHEDPEDEAKVTNWTIRQNLSALYVRHANDVPALLRREFEELLAIEPEQAGRVLGDLTRMAADVGVVFETPSTA
jgi:hypothetical protein